MMTPTLLPRAFVFHLVAATVLSGCGAAELPEEDWTIDEVGVSSEALCANGDGVNSAMAALAVATAKELRRWQPTKDFYIDSGSRLALTSAGKAQCADAKCWNTQALLDLQKATFNTVKLGKVTFNADNFRSRLYSEFNEQKICESRGAGANCPAEDHTLTFVSEAAGACDTLYTFAATTPTGGALKTPSLLKNKLIFVGYPENEYLQFSSTGKTVTIDPTYGLNETAATAAGSCVAACTKVSANNASGLCCSCNGSTKKLVRSTWSSTTYLCQ